ncbi:hypothetical protein BHE74_00022038 [Ensete ventricosum]|nr:hypothetical protein GW17_00061964 [Ensete ventricosum]RWW70283.1 hypothetical protein BHE74_00022038 [Ensete ventricosum]RZR79254.1 hypothetical protein BHM03_00004925 [Ensete ventricosum]
MTDASASMVAAGSTVEKCTSVSEGSSLRKHSRRGTSEQLAAASGSTSRVHIEKGKEQMETKEAPERGYTLRELCEVEDHAGAEKYFPTIITQLKATEGEGPLVSRWSAISGSSQVWTEGPLAREYLRGALHPFRVKELKEDTNKLRVELESLKSQQRDMEQEVRVLRSSLDGAQNDRSCLERDVLSLTEAATLLEAKLKTKGLRAATAYKVSQGSESGLEKMGRVSYEFRYQVVLERLRGKHPKISIKQDSFAKCPDNANVEMDLNQPFDDRTPSEK